MARFTNRLEDPQTGFRCKRLPRASAPDPDQRAWLERRRDDLRLSLAAQPGPELNQVLLKFMGGYAQFGTQPREMLAKVAIYAEAVGGLPTWAVDEARKAFMRPGWKSLWSGRGCPEAADLVAECRHILLPYETELARIEGVLEAELYETGASEDERKEVLAHVDDVLAELRAGDNPITERTEEEISVERASMARANERFRARERVQAEASGRGQAMWGRLPISDELAHRIGLRVPMPAEDEEEVH